jgi:hypothetical protein
VAGFINDNFLPVAAHIKEHPVWFHRFEAVWTPTVIVMDPGGVERFRIEGYLSKPEFRAHLELALGRLPFIRKQWADAERHYDIVASSQTRAVPEALYWSAVSRYKKTGDHHVLGQVAKELKERYPASIWTEKASPWLG